MGAMSIVDGTGVAPRGGQGFSLVSPFGLRLRCCRIRVGLCMSLVGDVSLS